MRVKVLVCKKCGYEGRVEVLSPDEARKNPRAAPARCPRCASIDVELHD